MDKRTDIWAFGCLLYELLTGSLVFRGDTLSDTIAAVLEREPDWHALPSSTPTRIRELLRRCLRKEAGRRLRDIGDARIEIEETLTDRTAAREVVSVPAAKVHASFQKTIGWVLSALVSLAFAGAGVVWYLNRSAPQPIIRLNMNVSPAEELTGLT